jgi:hypothetical protein
MRPSGPMDNAYAFAVPYAASCPEDHVRVLDTLTHVGFGQRVAEDEGDQLASYFVETDHWARLLAGGVDVIYGPKGSGKSALYSLLNARKNDLFDRAVLIAPAENPRGAPAFKALVADPPLSENEFIALWKIYFACLISATLDEYGAGGAWASQLRGHLERNDLVPQKMNLQGMLQIAFDYVKRLLRTASIEGGVKLDPHTQLPVGVTAKITMTEPTQSQIKRGYTSVDQLLTLGDRALTEAGYELWLLLDRLDVAFSDSLALEQNALRSLFRVYLDLRVLKRISVKIFLRSDIWRRITTAGFREASHITRQLTIGWNSGSLLNLVVRRAVQNHSLLEHYSTSKDAVLKSAETQRAFFYKIFPEKIDLGQNKPDTFDWMLSRTTDGSKQSAPRELIHLLNALRNKQVRQLEVGVPEPPDGRLFARSVFKDALPEVSKVRLEQTLYAEYPELRDTIERLRGEKTQYPIAALSELWRTPPDESLKVAKSLVDVGFFEQRGERQAPVFWVPFVYRDGLDLVQGTAEYE